MNPLKPNRGLREDKAKQPPSFKKRKKPKKTFSDDTKCEVIQKVQKDNGTLDTLDVDNGGHCTSRVMATSRFGFFKSNRQKGKILISIL